MNWPNPWEPRGAIDNRIREERFRELLQVTGEHPIVYQFARMYMVGDIVTFEEALQQIIRHLIRRNQILEDHSLYPSPNQTQRID